MPTCRLYLAHFRGKLVEYALHAKANYTVASLMSRVTSP